jgi:peroxiredoxin
LPLRILVDDGREVLKAYGVWHRVGFDAWNISRPALFLVDRTGIIRSCWVAEWQGEFPSREDILDGLAEMG